ncbi:nonribosomal peptide synthase [Clohesyomyces aquaticus]|uniref:Nonribosomal peptide synthase n=1 Tax=Clohesyomyces aquaticus TaxID=1231657 RepID=A0A1Y1ZNI1_9PLEO|nr:nonribosomal peptide synthase [Clohesyomyces aquaticus]
MSNEAHRVALPTNTGSASPREPANRVERLLRSVWAHVLNFPESQIPMDCSFLSCGGDSISAMQVMTQCRKRDVGLTVQHILRSKSISQLALAIRVIGASTFSTDEDIEAAFALTPIQRLWYSLPNQGQGHFNQSFHLKINTKTKPDDFRHAIEKLISRHSMLRARFQSTQGDTWAQRVTEDVKGSYDFRHLAVATKSEVDDAIAVAQKCLDPINGPLFAAVFFDLQTEQHAFVVGHHLVIDLVSWRVILEEMEEILRGEPLLAPTLPFQKWGHLQAEHAMTLSLEKVLPPVDLPALDFTYWGIEATANTYGNASHESFELDPSFTSIFLNSCHISLKTEPVEVLLAALIHAWPNCFDDRPIPVVFNEGHGREPWNSDIDVSRTIGWFTTVYPICVQPGESSVDTVRRVKDFRRQIPENGRAYLARRCLTNEGQEYFKNHWPMEISFNYLGQYQQLERSDALLQPLGSLAGETRAAGGTADVGDNAPRFALFEISAVVFKGSLRLAFTFNRQMLHQARIRQWVSDTRQVLLEMLQRLSSMPPEPTLSDFPLLTLTDIRFDLMLDRLGKIGISKTEVEAAYPSSSMQEGILLSRSREAGVYAAVTIHEIILPHGTPDWQKLADAWQRITKRHPALRTIFLESLSTEDGLYHQVVLKQPPPNIVHLECDDETDAMRKLEKQRSVAYENDRSPPHRFTICSTTAGRLFCCLEISHAIMDGHSMSVLFSDLRSAYDGLHLEEDGPLYSNYIAYLMEQPTAPSLQFWKSYLEGSEACSFPVLNDGPSVERHLRSVRLDFGDISVMDLNKFCKSHGLTMSNLFHAAWGLTLSLYVGSPDVVFGYLTSARDVSEIPGIEDMVGPVINTLVSRVSFSEGSKCLLDVLHQVQQDYMDSLPHRHTSLAEVQHSLSLSGASLFNTALSYRKLPPNTQLEGTGMQTVEMAPIVDPTEYPVSLNIEVNNDGALVDLDYWTDHLSEGQASNVASTFARALANIIFHAEDKLSTLDHVSAKHRQQIIGWNTMPDTLQGCVHHEFESQVRSQPDAPAVRGFDGDFSYAELDAVAERLAHYLVELGVGPEVFVPTCFDKSSFAVIAMLAVLKAGGAAVPLDANHPKPALESRVEDTRSQVVLTSATRSELFEEVVPNVLIVDSILLEDLPDKEGSPCTSVGPQNPAFVIFTSGSTGRPKGVILEHAAMVTSANAHGTNLGVGPGTRFLQFASYTFDNSLEEMFTTLQRGGCVCVPSEAQRMNDLAGAIAVLEANFMDLTPTVAALLDPNEVPTIKGMALGGEALTKAVVDQWCGSVHLHGQYGPSEASINAAWKDFKLGGEPTNIGKAIGSVSWLVDPNDRNRLVPIGCKGELLIEGPILSRGYLNDPEKTAEAFIYDPSWATAEGGSSRRLYCTGDLCYYTSTGDMIYLGRKDSQVKVNGQRIELGEIEHHAKLNLPVDAQFAAELVALPGPTKALTGFLCLGEELSASVNNARACITPMTDGLREAAKQIQVALSNVLPAYYVPTVFIPLASMPMTTSGKSDRRALRLLAQSITEDELHAYRLAGKSGRAPSGHVESTLARLWETVLKLAPNSIGVDDSFFRKGGDSVLSMRLVAGCRKEGLQLSVGSVFAQPRFLDMASAVEVSPDSFSPVSDNEVPFELLPEPSRRSVIDFAASECEIFPDSIEDIYPCTRLQEGLVALSTKEPGSYVAETVYRLPADIDVERFCEAWDRVAAAEPILRTRIIFHDSHGFLQVVVRDSIEWHDRPDLQDMKNVDRHLPAKHGGPLARYTIIGRGTSSPYFVWTAHHSVYDGWSLPALLRRVESCYRLTNQELARTVPYSRFIKYMGTIDAQKSDEFWVSTFENITAPQFPQLPNPDHKVQASKQLGHHVTVTRKPGIEITLASMIRAAFALLIATYTGSDDVLYGETNSGRDVPVSGIEDIVGPTISTSPVRWQLNRNKTVKQYLEHVQRQSSASLPFQFAGLQNIRKLSSDAAIACDFQSLLAIANGDSMKDPEGGLWDLQSTGTVGTNFFNYALVFNCTVTQDGVDIEVHYDEKAIETWLVQRLVQEFGHVLESFNSSAISHQTLNNLELLNAADREVIASWNSRPVNIIDKCIHNAIFREHVILRPSAIALEGWDTEPMTYKNLDERSTRLASKLISEGVEPGNYVPFCFDKSGWAIVAILAILKAGAAFVPLDFESPLLRLREIVSNVDAKLVLCAPQYVELCQLIPCKTLTVDRNTTKRHHGRLYTLPTVVCRMPAYAMFTSGSTGKPKGAVIDHSSFVSSSTAFAPAMKITSASRVLQFASYTFDACLIEILSTLMLGGTVCVPDQASRTNDLPGVINKFNINWATLTPSVVRTMDPSQVPSLKTLILVGEAMSQHDLETWAPCVVLGNGYGPTEASVVATVNIMTPDTKPNNLGKVVTARGWVVSKTNHNILSPLGAVGELLIDGGGVGKGYLKNPEKTAEVFVTDVTWNLVRTCQDEGSTRKFYKTGDLVRYNEDGTLMYLGRKDSQAKVRGQRLELSEVEHHLIADPLIQNSLAYVPTVGPCAKRLVGVIVLQGAAETSRSIGSRPTLEVLPPEIASFPIATVRDRLCGRLPSYMVPSLWIAVAAFPLMSSGKLDKRRVGQWLEHMNGETYRVISTLGLDRSKDAATSVESKIQAIIAKSLNLPTEDVHLNQSFIHIGGDSIAAMQVSSQCRGQGLVVSVQDIIRSKSITELAAKVSLTGPETTGSTNNEESGVPFDLAPIQRVFFDTVGHAYNHFNQSVILRLSRRFQLNEIQSAIRSLVTIHPMLRGRFFTDESCRWRQRIEKDPDRSFRLNHHRVQADTNAILGPILDQSQASFDITNGPTFSADLFDIDSNSRQAIALIAHHLVIDVVSWGVCMEDLQNLLNGVVPPPQSTPFKTWSQQQADRAKRDSASVIYPISGIPPPDLDYWGMRDNANINSDVITEDIELSPKDSMLLLGAHDALATESVDVLLASLLESFRKIFPDRATVAIHNEGHGREPFDSKQDLSRTIGWFTTLTPIYLPVPIGEPTDIVSTIRWVKDLRQAIPEKGRAYFAHRLLTLDGQRRFVAHWPAEVTFNYLGRMQSFGRQDGLLQRMDSISTTDIAGSVPRFSLFEVTAVVIHGIVKLSFSFNRCMKRIPEIKSWISECRKTLVVAVDELLQLRPEPSLSTFKLLPPSYGGASKLSSNLPADMSLDDVEDLYPASPMQLGLLLSQLKQPDLYAYHCIFSVRPTNGHELDPQRLADAWQIVVHRHPMLRTVFINLRKTGVMDQAVLKDYPARVSWIHNCEDGDAAELLRRQSSVDYRGAKPPHCFTICKTNMGRVWVKLEMSHTICDGSSIPIILRDLARAYEGSISRSDPGPRYSDYIAHVLSSSRDDDINYWKSYLSGIEPCNLPTLTDGIVGPHELGAYELHIANTAEVQAFCRREGVTLSTLLKLAWALSLHCYVGASDVSFGVVAGGRDIPVRDVDQAVGCFVTMLICRLDLTNGTSILGLLECIQMSSADAMAHQGCSLADVQHELQLPSLFNTVFTFQRRQLSRDPEKIALVYDDVSAEDPGEYHVTVNADVTEEGTTVDFGFWKDKICQAQAENMVKTFEKIIDSIVGCKDRSLTIADLDFSTPESLRQISYWNRDLPPPVRRCAHEIISEQALLRPLSTRAVEGWDGNFTYQEFDELTTRLAFHLNTLGVTTETFVPILFEKSSWAIVAMIAIMKAGGAYVPLDPKAPLSRLRQLVRDVSAKLILCSRSLCSRVSEVGSPTFTLDRKAVDGLPVVRGNRPSPNVSPDNAAYLLFTSGSTGMPKGTIITHQSICTSAHAISRNMEINSTSRTFQFASYTFDASCVEILVALTVGATVCVPSEDERMNDPAGAIQRLKATWCFLTPSVLSTMKPERVTCLKTLSVGGELVPEPLISMWAKHTRFLIGYGPTETVIFAAHSLKSTAGGKGIVDTNGANIGLPSGCRHWVVHPKNHDKLMPIGAVGELVIEGYTTARGYLGDDTKTAKVFIKDPAWVALLRSQNESFQTTRMYKSGDLVRYNSDGSINFISRKDTQIKLNGQRIELGEIEYHIKSKCPEGMQACVELVAPASRNSNKALAVFLTSEQDHRGGLAETIQPSSIELPAADEILLPMDDTSRDLCKSLENALSDVLPSYMIPSIFVPITNMPWTTSSKLDRGRLRNLVQNLSKDALAPYRLSSLVNKKLPRTDMERKLQALASAVLGLPTASVGIDDNLIRLGLDSVSMMGLVTAAQAEQIDVSVIDIFNRPKLCDLASACGRVKRSLEMAQSIEPFQLLHQDVPRSSILDEIAKQCRVIKSRIQDVYPVTPLQEAFITLSTKQPGAYVAQHILSLASSVDMTRFKAAWEKAVQEFDLLRTRIIQIESGNFMQTVLNEDPIHWLNASELAEAEDAILHTPPHLGGLLAAYTIVKTESNDRYFVWTIHHALYDGWSIPFMLRRVEQLYEATALEVPKIPYTRFIKYLLDIDRNASAAFWQAHLAGAAPYQFPQRHHVTGDEIPNGQVRNHIAHMPSNRHDGITPSTVIRAAWSLLVAAYTGCDDVVFGETLTGRDISLPGITELCGPTLTTCPTRVRINRRGTVQDLLHEVAKSATDRIPHQHTGLSEIRRINADTAAACDFQNLLALQTGGQQPAETMWQFHTNELQANYFTYPLVIECKTNQSRVEISAYYNANLLTEWQVQRILFQLDTILGQLQSISALGDLQVFSEQDRLLVQSWNAHEPTVVDETMHSLFLKQATSRPEATAVSAFDGEFSYAELKALASRLAQELIRLGLGPETLVPLCMDKSKWAMVSILGVLMAGAAYVPLSPEHPASRHAQILRDCRSSVLICSPSYESRFVGMVGKVLVVDETSICRLPSPHGELPLRANSSNMCYVMYTSGTTGVPKGVVIDHRAIASSSAAICKSLNLGMSSRVFQFASFVFDASVMEILTALTCGATVCIPSEQERTGDITAAINKLRATWACLTPSVASVIDGPKAVPSLKTLAAGAEAMTPETVDKWSSGLQLLNAYGPTEAAIVALSNSNVARERLSSNIGCALESGRAWIVDPLNPHKLCPVGAVGELCLQGAHLSRGYLNNIEKTKEVFVENPAFLRAFPSQTPWNRIYRTGDLAQYAPDGSILYMGRRDNQIKIAGQRIELGEVEHHLQADPGLQHVVVCMPNSPGRGRLTVVLSVKQALSGLVSQDQPWNSPLSHPSVLAIMKKARDRLSDLLPPYMVPSVWIAVSKLPVLASAKLDRKQVGAWLENMDTRAYSQILEMESDLDVVAPVTATGELLRTICARVLDISSEKINLSKPWLSLGGDSITAMQFLARCRKEGISLTLNQVLRSKSLSQLAKSVGDLSLPQDHVAEQLDKPFDLSPVQRMYFESIGDEKSSHFNQSFTVQLSRQIDPGTMKMALDAVVQCHSMLRARLSKNEAGLWRQIIPATVGNAYHFGNHDVSSIHDIPRLASKTQASLDILNGPVFGVDLFNTQDKGQVLFLAAHHLVVDIMSWKIICGDLEECLTTGSSDSLHSAVSFQYWCARQAENALENSQVEEGSRARQFSIPPADLACWGMDLRRNEYGDAERDHFLLDENVSSKALNDHHVLRTDAVDLFLAAILHSFSRIFIDRPTPTIFNETHGREAWPSSDIDLSRTVGWFTAMYPVHVSIQEDEDDVLQTVRKVKDSRRKITENGRSYFAHRYLTQAGRQRYAHHMPMEILFNYLGKTQHLKSDDSLFQAVPFSEDEETEMSDMGTKTARPALFEISTSVMHGQLQFSFTYNRWMKNQKGIRRWIAECQRTLEEIVTNLATIANPQPTLADFPLLPIESYDRLQRVIKTLPNIGVHSYEQLEDMYPCVPMQEGMILSQIKDPESYLSFSIFEVKAKHGPVDVRKLSAAWNKVVTRHPALRTVFIDSVCKGGVFDQVVVKNPDSGILIYNCKESDLSEKLESIRYSQLNGKKRPRLPHQFTIVQTASGRIVVKMEINHAVIDGGSHDVIRRDLEAAYEGRLSDEGPLYSDYIRYLERLPAGAAEAYWKDRLRGVQPCYFPVAPQDSSKHRKLHSLYLEFDSFADLQRLAKETGVTFSNIMLAAWAMVLRAYTGSSDVCYGYLTSGRNVPIDNIFNAVGAFIQMLVLRINLSHSQSLVDVCQKVQSDYLESLPYQHCSLAQFQHELGLSGRALFNTVVSIQNHAAAESTGAPESNIEFEHLDAKDPSEFAITVNVEAGYNNEGVLFTYWTDSISDEEAKNLSSTMAKVLSQILADSTQTISQVDAAIAEKPILLVKPRSRRPSRPRLPSRNSSLVTIPRIEAPTPTPIRPTDTPDWGSLIRSIVSEMVPQIVDQVLSKHKSAPTPSAATVNEMSNQMAGMLGRRASQSLRVRPSLETGSIRSRRMSVASDTESRINFAAEMVAAAGVMATEALKSVPPDFVEKKLLTIWSELLDMVEDSIGHEDSFFQLGGDSIIAMRLVGAAREEGLSMTVADVFKNPTFSDMARVVRVAGEVIDQVMSQQAGSQYNGESSTARPPFGTMSKPSPQLPERAASAWKDFQSMVSEQAVSDGEDDARSPPSTAHREQSEKMFKKWQGFASKPQATSSPQPQIARPVHTIHEDQSANKSVSLLGDPNVDSVISKVQVFKGGISDVFEVTDFQALAITGTLLESRWMLNYFFLDGEGPLDLRKLKQTAFRLVQAFDILRTVFVPYGDRFLQVVLRKLQPDFIFQETDNLDDFTTDLRQRDREHGPRLGETFVQFIVAKQKKTEQYRIFIRLSHAQYDGYCLPKILGALQDGYNGLPISSAPSFGNYVRECAKTVAGAHDHWREVLRGSKMTEIVHRYGPNYQRSAGSTVNLKKTLQVGKLSHLNLTTATIVKAAWASTLARVAGSSDIIFGHVISGRNGSVPNVESIIGPCLNMVPVRVLYRPEWTVLDLLRYIQDQQIANMQYESLGFREITRNCTEWPDWTNFSSVLQHNQNIHEEGAKVQLGGIEYKVGSVGTQEDFADFSVLSTCKGGNELEVVLTFAPNTTVTTEFAQEVFDAFCATTIAFADDPYTLLPSPSALTSQSSTTLGSSSPHKKSIDKQPLALPTDTGLSKHEIHMLAAKLRSAWQQILRDSHGTPAPVELNSNFFELGGDIMGLAQVASILDQEGLRVRVEDLIEKCVFREMVGVLAAERMKEVEKENMGPWGEKGKKREEEKKRKAGKAKLERRESGLGGLVRKIGMKRRGTGTETK